MRYYTDAARRSARADESARLESVCGATHRGFESHLLRFCNVAGQSGQSNLHFVVISTSSYWLVTFSWIKGKMAKKLSVLRDYPYIKTCNENNYPCTFVGSANSYMIQL